jgi:hypothetical protein
LINKASQKQISKKCSDINFDTSSMSKGFESNLTSTLSQLSQICQIKSNQIKTKGFGKSGQGGLIQVLKEMVSAHAHAILAQIP